MSSAYASLRGLFSKNSNPTTVASIAAKTLIPISPVAYEDPKIASLVKKFKESCDRPKFRSYFPIYDSTVRQFSKYGNFCAVRDILEHQKQYPDIREERFAVRLISLYGKAKMFDDAQKLFDELPSLNCERTVMSFNGLLGACLKSEKYDLIREMFNELPDKLSVKPDIVSYNTLIKAFCDMGSFDSAVLVLDDMSKNDIQVNARTFNTLLHAFCHSKRFSEAVKIWALMEEKGVEADVWIYNEMLRGFVECNQFSEAASLFDEMEKKKIELDIFTYNALLKGFINEGNMEEAKKWYKKMDENECPPDIATFNMLIPLACDKEDFDYAYKLCKVALKKKCWVYVSVIKRVVDGLVERSKVEAANKLVKMLKSSGYKDYYVAGVSKRDLDGLLERSTVEAANKLVKMSASEDVEVK